MDDNDTTANVAVCTLMNLAIHILDDIDFVNPTTKFVDDNEYETTIISVNTLKAFDEELQLIGEWLAKLKHVEDHIELVVEKKQVEKHSYIVQVDHIQFVEY